MSLGSRIVKRGKTAVGASLASTPREPLLFLYPRWIRKSSSASSSPSPVIDQDGIRPARTAQPSRTTAPLPHPATLTKNPNSLERRFSHPKKNGPGTGLSTGSAMRKGPTRDREISDIMAGHKISFPETVSAEQKLEKQVSRVLEAAEQAKIASAAAIETQKEFQRLRREELKKQWEVDWREILADLAKHTPDHGPWLEKALKVVVPKSSMAQLFQGIDEHMWDIARKYGCSVQLGAQDEDGTQCRTFIISGPLVALAKAVADVIRTHRDVEITAPSNFKSGVAIRHSKNISTSSGEHTNIRRVVTKDQELPLMYRPDRWTTDSFLAYVRSIISSNITSHQRMYELKISTDVRADAAITLRELFDDPACRSSITKTACHEAMQFLVKHHLIQDVRILFVRMDMMKIPMDAETFNIMLRGTAKKEDLHNFRFILHLMLKRGFTPNPATWTAFLMAHSDIHVKTHIVTAMQQKGIVSNKHTLKAICQELVQAEVESSLDRLQSQKDFVAHMDARYGLDWLSVDVGNRILNVMGARGLISHCWEFLHFMASRFIPPNNVSINTILGHCNSQGNLAGAIEILRSIPSAANFTPDEDTYTRLFSLAWKAQCYNVARVAWRYACLSAATTFRMRHRMFKNLLGNAVPHDEFKPFWRQLAGPVIFGTSYRGAHPTQAANRLWRYNRNVEKLALPEVAHVNKEDEPPVVTTFSHPSDLPYKLWSKTKPGSKSKLEPDSKPEHDPRINLVTTKSKTWLKNQGADVSYLYPNSIYPFVYKPENPPRQINERKTNVLQALLGLDHMVFKAWRPAKPLSEMLMLAWEKDQEWRAMPRPRGVVSGERASSQAEDGNSHAENTGSEAGEANSQTEGSESQAEKSDSKAEYTDIRVKAANIKTEMKWKIGNAIGIPLLWKADPGRSPWEWK